MVAPDKLIRGMVIDEELKAEIERRYNGWDDLRQQLASLEQEVEQCCYGESLAFAAMRQQLADSQNQVTLLRDLIPKRIPDGFVSFGKYYAEQESIFNPSYKEMTKFKNKYLSDCEEALAATADLDGLILCEKKPVAWLRDVIYEMPPEFAFSWLNTQLHYLPLYRAWEPTK